VTEICASLATNIGPPKTLIGQISRFKNRPQIQLMRYCIIGASSNRGFIAPFPMEKKEHSGLKKFTASLETLSAFANNCMK
jgi:hypothetical protein